MKIPVGISNRHCHLREETFVKLFGNNEIVNIKDLNQPGEFVSNNKVAIKTNDGYIENVRVLGPFRKYDQVEISKTDAFKLKINPPVRKSGDVSGSASITLVGLVGEVELDEGCVIANRHIHFSPDEAKRYNVSDNQVLKVRIDTEKGGEIDVFAKVQSPSYFELHIDMDDANAFLLTNNDEVEVDI